MLKFLIKSKGNLSMIIDNDNKNKPIILRESSKKDLLLLKSIKDHPHITILNHYEEQLFEYIKCYYPKKDTFTPLEIETYKDKLKQQSKTLHYGTWVYYPWKNTLIHLLDESEFIMVRSNRNKYKITYEEEATLATKKVGIVGLSVGNSIAITIATERLAKEIRITDFDTLELSNLNRIRYGVDKLGISKALLTAREIYEIDPYLKVVTYDQGLNNANIDDFFTKNGALDLVLEECDDLSMKVMVRRYAKKLKIPVLMETNDKGMVDIERFDLEPDRPLFHGLIPDIDTWDLLKIKKMTDEQKVPYVLSILGSDAISDRFTGSLIEIKTSIRSWPQLASHVSFGAGLATDIARKILLNSYQKSGRFFVDLDEIFKPKDKEENKQTSTTNKKRLPIEQIENFEHLFSNYSGILTEEEMKTILNHTIQAPTGKNGQPWLFCFKEEYLQLYGDFKPSYTDYNNKGDLLGIGSALENLRLSSQSLKKEAHFHYFPDKNIPHLICNITFSNTPNLGSTDTLFFQINKRETNRKLGNETKINPSELSQLETLFKNNDHVGLKFISEKTKKADLTNLIATGDRLRFMDKNYHTELIDEIRWTPQEAKKTKDGLDLDTLELSPVDRAGIHLCKSWNALKFLRNIKGGFGLEKMTRKLLNSSPVIGYIDIKSFDDQYFIEGGRLIQKLWLKASELNISFQPMASLPFFFMRLHEGKGKGMSDLMKNELTTIYPNYKNLLDLDESRTGIFLFRLFHSAPASKKSFRKPIEMRFKK